MTIEVKLENAETVREAFRKARTEVIERWYGTVRKHAYAAVRIIQTRYRGASATTPTATKQGTGNLRASYAQQTDKVAGGVETQIGLMRVAAKGQALKYGAVHEEGAVIRPVRTKFLAIPLPSIRSPSGLAPRPSDFPRKETFIVGGLGGGTICRRLPGGVIQPLFALRREVRIPARPPGGAINAAFTEVAPQLETDLQQDAVDVIGGAP